LRAGVNLPQYDVDFSSGRCDPDVLRSYASVAEELGFDSVWLSDHPFAQAPDGHVSRSLDPAATAAHVAASTSRVKVGTLVMGLSLRSVSEIAGIARTWEAVAPGRFTVGLGAGWNPRTHAAMGVERPSFRARAAVLDSAAAAVRAACPGVGILIGGWGDPVLATAARHADVWNLAWDPGPEAFRAVCRRLDAACERIGRAPGTLSRSVGVTVLAAENRRSAQAAVSAVARRAPYLSGLTLGAVSDPAIAGDPMRCAERLAAYGADEVVVTPFVRDGLDMLTEIAAACAAVR